MAAVVSMSMAVSPQQLMQLGTAPQGALRLYWLRLLADVDRTAKQKLSNQLVNVRSGNLRSSQQTPFLTVQAGKLVGVAQNVAAYAYFVHEGTRAHEIRPRKGKFLTGWSHAGHPVFTPLVHHPGTTARPWLREAVHEAMARAR